MSKSANTITFPKGPLPPSYFTENRGHHLTAVAITFLVLLLVTFALRQISRQIQRVPFGWDDAVVIPALLVNILICILALLAVPLSGAGRHTLAVLREDKKKIEFMGLNALLIMPIAYSIAVALSKGAILQLYLRIFRFGYVRWISRVVGVIITVHAIVVVFVSIFQCKPISSLWKDIVRTNCIDTEVFFAYASVPNFITDIVMLITPLPEIWKLNTSRQMKLGVTITFMTASVGIITSILRTVAFFRSEIFKDPTWESVNLMIYIIAEPGTYFLSACFPTLRPILRWAGTKATSTFPKGFYSRERLGSSSEPVEQLVHIQGGGSDGNSNSKKVRCFDSILLSDISHQKSVTNNDV